VFAYQAPAGATVIEVDRASSNLPVLAGLKQAVTAGKDGPPPSKDPGDKPTSKP
jgi:hypothetical protein